MSESIRLRGLRGVVSVACLVLSVIAAGSAMAQSYRHSVLIDSDNNAATGCTVNSAVGSVSGIDLRLDADVSGLPPQVTAVSRSECSGASFAAPVAQGGGYPVALDGGIGGADAIELAMAYADVPNPASTWRIALLSESDSGADLLGPFSANGLGSAPLPPATPSPELIPSLSPGGIIGLSVAMALLLLWGARRHRGLLSVLMICGSLSFVGVAWAAHFIADGNLSDWAGVSPNGSDPTGDSTSNETAIDIVAGFAQREGDNLFFRIDVANINQPPVAADDSYSTDEDTPLNVPAPGVLGNDSDPDGDALTAALASDVTNGVLTLNADGSFTYTPDAGFSGLDSFGYYVTDGTLVSFIVNVNIAVAVVNDAPVAVADSYNTDEDVVLNVPAAGVLANDTDADGDPLSAVLDTNVSNGTLSLSGDGSFSYMPNANFNGSDSFSYHTNDGIADSNVVAVSITVNPVNDAPVAVADSYSTDEDIPLNIAAFGVLANDSDVEGDSLTAVLDTDVSNGTLSLNADGSFSYTPAAGYNGMDGFTYHANDGVADSVAVAVSIAVAVVNDPPVAVDDARMTTEDFVTVIADGDPNNLLSNDSDPDGDTLVVTAYDAISTLGASVVVNADGGYSHDPTGSATLQALTAGDSMNDTFTYTIQDPGGLTSTATVTMNVEGANDAPVAIDDAFSTDEDTPLVVPAPGVLANDTDVDTGAVLTAAPVSGPVSGLLALNADGSFTYTPDPDFNGSDSFTYRANDGTADSNIATVSITVNAVNDPPTAVDDAATVAEDSSASAIAVLANDANPDSGAISISGVIDPANGTVVIIGGGTGLTYQPDPGYCNDGVPTDNFTYTLSPGGSSATVAVTVTCVNDPPVAIDNSLVMDEDAVANVPAPGVLANDFDPDGDALTAVLDTNPSNGALILNANGSYTYTPDLNYNGSDSFTYHANDGVADSNIATVNITINPVNDAPVAAADSWETIGNTTLVVDRPALGTPQVGATTGMANGVLGNDSDPVEGDALSVAGIVGCADVTAPFDCASSNGGMVSMYADGTFTFTPAAGDTAASDSFQYVVSDGSDTANATVTINLTQRVWYVKNNATAGGTGRSSDPFDTLAEAQTASLANDWIFVYYGDGTTTGQSAGFVIKDGQHLIGEHAGLSIPVGVNGAASPTVLVSPAAGNRPLLDNTTAGVASGVSASDAIPAEVVGLSLGGNGNAVTLALNGGAASGSTAITDNEIRRAGGGGIHANHSGTGTWALSIDGNQWNAAGSFGVTGIGASTGSSGELRLNLSNNTGIRSPGSHGVLVDGAGGNIVITGFASNTVSGDNGLGLEIDYVTFDADPDTAGYQTVSGGTTVVGTAGNGVGSTAMFLGGVSGDLAFDDLDLYGAGGLVLSGTGPGGVDVAAGTGLRFTVAPGMSTISSTTGSAINIYGATIDLQLAQLIANGLGGVTLASVNNGTTPATFSAPAGSAITSTSSRAFYIDGGNAEISYAGTITNTGGQSVVVQSRTGGTATFTGAIADTGQGITVSSNAASSTTSFRGGLNLSTGGNAAFTATNGGVIEVCDENPCNPAATGTLVNTLSTTTATALNVAGTTIGAGGVTFQSVSSNGATNGIILNNTGNIGAFIVTGDGPNGTDGSGGTIQNISQRGISITNASNVTLRNIDLNNVATTDNDASCTNLVNTSCNAGVHLNGVSTIVLDNIDINGSDQIGINGVTVSGMTLENSDIRDCGNEVNEGCLQVFGLGGTSAISNSTIALPSERAAYINNINSPNLILSVINSTFSDTQSSGIGADGLELNFMGSSTATVDVVDSAFRRNRTNGLQVLAQGTASVGVDITGSTFDREAGIGIGIDLSASDSAGLDFNVIGNPLINSRNGSALNVFADGSAVIEGRINDNPSIQAGGAGASGFGISVVTNENAQGTVQINNNVVSNIGADAAIRTQARLKAGGACGTVCSAGRLDATITNNTTSVNAGGLYDIWVQSNDDSTICANVANNAASGATGVAFRERTNAANSMVLLQGFVTSAVATWNGNGNTPINLVSDSNNGTLQGGTCTTPSNPVP